MELFNSMSELIKVVFRAPKATLLAATKWMIGSNMEPERTIESGTKDSEDWSAEMHLLFEDLVETII